jgi:hypothetical protein
MVNEIIIKQKEANRQTGFFKNYYIQAKISILHRRRKAAQSPLKSFCP